MSLSPTSCDHKNLSKNEENAGTNLDREMNFTTRSARVPAKARIFLNTASTTAIAAGETQRKTMMILKVKILLI